jgi:hypothetical protein
MSGYPHQPALSYATAVALLRKPGHKLTVTHLKNGREYFVAPGGRVTLITAKRLLERCREIDPGLFPGLSQAWRLKR